MKPRADQNLWTDDGWLTSAEKRLSPNFGARPAGVVIDMVVVHSISLPPGEYGGGNVQALFMNELDWNQHPYYDVIRGLQVSAHFFVERGGRVWQFVSADMRAWHAGQSSFHDRTNCNDFSVGIELEGLEGARFELAQYQALAQLCRQLHQRYPIRHVVGHEHIAPGRKLDPGPGFDWHALQRAVGWQSQCFPALGL
jgi:N-acetyl-anhydromuramoyl-L-alanine amidase